MREENLVITVERCRERRTPSWRGLVLSGALSSLFLLSACGSGGGGGGGEAAAQGVAGDSLPTIESFSPPPDAAIPAGKTARFEVTARPDGAPVSYAWALDGVRVQGSDSTFSLPTSLQDPDERTVEVEVSSGGEEVTVLLWKLRIEKGAPANSPPSIVSALPPGPVSLLPGESLSLLAAAADPDGSGSLSYRWSVDGQPQQGSGPSFTFRAAGLREGQYEVEVVADDGEGDGGGSFVWTVTVDGSVATNRPPLVTSALPLVMPRIADGSAIRLLLEAEDPEGAPLVYHWEVNGSSQAGSGNTFLFRPSGPGFVDIGARADDGGGGTEASSFFWRIETQRVAAPVEPVPGTSRVRLAWDRSTTDDQGSPLEVAGYRVYQARFPNQYTLAQDVGGSTEARLVDLTAGERYYFAVTAYDEGGLESLFSTPVSFIAR